MIDRAVQLHGGDGVRTGTKVEELYREIRALRIYEGASEVQKIVIAREIDFVQTRDSLSVNGIDATAAIRAPEVDAAVSHVAANSAVREEMRTRQRQWISDHGGGVVEGRDIGSVVFPDATLKVYLVASPMVRAKRRVAQHGGDVDEIARAIAERDERDSTRDDSPLRQMPDAVIVDTSERTVDQVIDEIRGLLAARGKTS